jgi:hypothetical protein
MIRISVGGTSAIFKSDAPVSKLVPLFCKFFNKNLYNLETSPNGAFLVAFNHNPDLYRRFIEFGGNPNRAILIRLEPECIFPAQYNIRVTKKYGLILSPGASNGQEALDRQIRWPYEYHLDPSKPSKDDPKLVEILKRSQFEYNFLIDAWEKRTHLITMIAANKVSSISKSNYSLRRELARSLPSEVLEVFGPLWNGSRYQMLRHRAAVLVAALRQGTLPNIREIYGSLFRRYPTAKGSVVNKHALLEDSKFSLIVENSNKQVTEKIFDSIINGSIPIYVGPDLESVGLPNNIAITHARSLADILKIIHEIDNVAAASYLHAMHEFTMSENFRDNWAAEEVYKKLCLLVIEYIGGVVK